nr:MAG TPA: hypothetical protein [Caudoviricetes sp.]
MACRLKNCLPSQFEIKHTNCGKLLKITVTT